MREGTWARDMKETKLNRTGGQMGHQKLSCRIRRRNAKQMSGRMGSLDVAEEREVGKFCLIKVPEGHTSGSNG